MRNVQLLTIDPQNDFCIIFNVDIEKYVTPPIKLIPETVQVQTNNPVQLENK